MAKKSADDGEQRKGAVRLTGLDLRDKAERNRGITVFDAAGRPHLWSRNGLPLLWKASFNRTWSPNEWFLQPPNWWKQ